MANLPIRQLKNKYLIIGKAGEMCIRDSYNLDNEIKFLKDQVRVPIWFKKDRKSVV